MTKITITTLGQDDVANGPGHVAASRVRDARGHDRWMWSLDAASDTLDADLLRASARNVALARSAGEDGAGAQPAPVAERPLFLVVGGPNGSGKTTLHDGMDLRWSGRSVRVANPDLVTARIQSSEALASGAANLEAVTRVEAWLEAAIRAHQTVGVETVLSTGKYRRLVALARERGYEVWLVYVVLDAAERNLERVRARVARGGHDVPADRVVARRARSLEQLPWFFAHADRAWVLDNSGAEPRLVATKAGRRVALDPDGLPEVANAVRLVASGEVDRVH